MRRVLLLSLLAGCGLGSFDPLPEFDFYTAIALADLDGDGRADEISVWMHVDNIPGNAGSVGVRRQTAPGQFASRERYGVGAEPRSIAVADVDGDGRPDLVVAAQYSDRLDILRQEAGGGFTHSYVPTGRGPRSVAVADVDGDGRADLVAGGDAPTLHRQQADGSFGSEPIAGDRFVAIDADGTPVFASSPLVLVDLDKNGVDEAVVAETGWISVSWNGGAPIPYAGPGNASALAVGDLDDDGWPDLVVGSGDGGVAVIRNDAGVLRTPELYAHEKPVVSVAIGDVDGDGRPDVAYANTDRTAWLLQDASGAFLSP